MAMECDIPWINVTGGLGDALMLSSVLKLVYDRHPDRRFGLVSRTGYRAILADHPAIARSGQPPAGARILGNNYWDVEPLGSGTQRAFQILARMYGLDTPVDERLYMPGAEPDVSWWDKRIPWQDGRNVLIAPTSASPRKELHPPWWERCVQLLRERGAFVAQAGTERDRYVRGAYSLLGLTTPRELAVLLDRFDLVITSDNYVMHAAHLRGRKAIVLWGPSDHRVYGYAGHRHIQAGVCSSHATACIGPSRGHLYSRPCDHPGGHCMLEIAPERVCEAAAELLA